MKNSELGMKRWISLYSAFNIHNYINGFIHSRSGRNTQLASI